MRFKVVYMLLILLIVYYKIIEVHSKLISDKSFLSSSFNDWMVYHKKNYLTDSKETLKREAIFQQNKQYVLAHNRKNAPYNLSLGKFADMTVDEFQGQYLGYVNEPKNATRKNNIDNPSKKFLLPSKVDWRKRNMVTRVKSQGKCGSCWAFGATGVIEGAYALRFGRLISLSEQEIVDCDLFDFGCDGGTTAMALYWIFRNGGLTVESNYPYTGQSQGYCNPKKNNTSIFINEYILVPHYDKAALMEAVALMPVAVNIEAYQTDFMLYSSGIATLEHLGSSCGEQINHVMLAVGYGSENGLDYWILKNSWGPDWGEGGYMRLQRSVDKNGKGVCGVNTEPVYVFVSTNQTYIPSDEYPPVDGNTPNTPKDVSFAGLSNVILSKSALIAPTFISLLVTIMALL